MPRTRYPAIVAATSLADAAPPGRNQVTVQLSAPSIARVTTAGSRRANSPLRDAVGDEPADRVLVAVAFVNETRPQGRSERANFEMRRRAFHVVEQRADVRGQNRGEAVNRTPAPALRRGDGGQHLVERAVLTVDRGSRPCRGSSGRGWRATGRRPRRCRACLCPRTRGPGRSATRPGGSRHVARRAGAPAWKVNVCSKIEPPFNNSPTGWTLKESRPRCPDPVA